jgi:hypothetical protein
MVLSDLESALVGFCLARVSSSQTVLVYGMYSTGSYLDHTE